MDPHRTAIIDRMADHLFDMQAFGMSSDAHLKQAGFHPDDIQRCAPAARAQVAKRVHKLTTPLAPADTNAAGSSLSARRTGHTPRDSLTVPAGQCPDAYRDERRVTRLAADMKAVRQSFTDSIARNAKTIERLKAGLE